MLKILHRCRFLYLCTVQRVLKTHWDSRRLDWTRLGRCEHHLTLESDWTGLDSTRLCWCVRTLRVQFESTNSRIQNITPTTKLRCLVLPALKQCTFRFGLIIFTLCQSASNSNCSHCTKDSLLRDKYMCSYTV